MYRSIEPLEADVAEERPSGLVISDDDGNYYYLRPETLAQAKMPEEDVSKLKSGMGAASGKDGELSMSDMQSVAGGALSTTLAPKTLNVGSLNLRGVKTGTMTSTIMCPW